MAGQSPGYAGISGTISGHILDQKTGMPLPGAAIIIEGTTLGTMADKNGAFVIHNLPAGTYDVSISMIGYRKLTIQNVLINVDRNTEKEISLSAEVLSVEAIVVTEANNLIQSDLTSSTYFISGDDISNRLPVDSYLDAVALLPGVVGNHVRGGRETDVVYMLDGLPLQGSLSRTLSSTLPNSSIVEMMVQTGGFSAEYGDASSGIVNVITKDGRNRAEGNLRFYTDFAETGITDNHNSRRLEFDVGGPLTIGLGGPLISAKYFISGNLNLSDTPHRKELQDAFDSPIFKNYNINSKLSFDIANNTILTLQGIVSNWRWRQFQPQWRLNPLGLAENEHWSHRLSVSLTHTFSSKLFSTLRVANYRQNRRVNGDISENPPSLVFDDPTDPLSPVLSGKQPWVEDTEETINLVKLDVVAQVNAHHLLKVGFDSQNYRLDSRKTQFVPLSTLDHGSIVFNRNANDFNYKPSFFALYVQDKIQFNGVTADLGVRYDVFSPQITVQEIPQDLKRLQVRLNAPAIATNSENHTPLSPRLGVSVPLSGNESLHASYGWYYQMPPLYYLYTNSSFRLDSYLPFVGNTQISPTKTVSSELSYKRIVSDDWSFALTGFVRTYSNLVDTQTFVLGEDLLDEAVTNVGYTQYTNTGSGKASGIELTIQKNISRLIATRISYTYMRATGTNSLAEDEFNGVVFGLPTSESGKRFPLSWDQRHSLIIDAGYNSSNLQLNVLYRLFSPLPITTQGSSVPNNTRLSWRNLIDARLVLASPKILGRHINPFFEVRNLLDESDILNNTNSNGVGAYQLFDPLRTDIGRRFRVGMNFDF